MNSLNKINIIIAAFAVIVTGNYLMAFSPESGKDEAVLFFSLILIALVYVFVLSKIRKSVTGLKKLSLSILEKGDLLTNTRELPKEDVEIVSTWLEKLTSEINQSTAFVNDIKEGKLTSGGAVEEVNGGLLMQSLAGLRNQLLEIKKGEAERKWVSEGMNRFVELLRRDNRDAEDFYDSIIKGIVKYLNANQGSLFVVSEVEGRRVLKLAACYAYNRKKFLNKEVEAGQGLVGQVFLEKESTFLKEIPAGYVSITSGLGEAPPRNLLIVPFKLNDKVECIIELASFHEFPQYQVEFLEKVGENIASTISAYKISENTKKLLEESQNQAEIMQAQEEELRQNMEELEATQESLQRESHEKAKIQAEIIKTRNFLQQVMNAIPDPIYVKDKEHKIVVINDAYSKVHQVSKDDVLGKNEYDLFSKEEAEAFYNEDEKLFREGGDSLKEEKVKLAGKEIYRIAKKRVIEDEDGNPFLVGIYHDVTHIKEIEQELAKEKYLMDALMKNATDYIYFKDRESKFIRMSDHMLQLFNAKSPDEVVGKSDFDFFTAEHAQPAFDAEMEIMKTGKPVMNLVEKETWEDGRVSYVSTSKMALKNSGGQTIGTFGISRDVTETKLMEAKMEKREKLLTSLISVTNERILLVDKDFQYQFISPAFGEKFHLNPFEVEGNKINWFVHSDDEEELRITMKKLLPSEEVTIGFRHIGALGKYEKVEATLKNCLKDESLEGFVFRIRDNG